MPRNRPPAELGFAVWMQREIASALHRMALRYPEVSANHMAVVCDTLAAVKRIERVRLYPTPRQVTALRFMLDVTRELYNALLQQRRDAYRLRGIRVTAGMQSKELTVLRSDDARVRAVYRECQDAVVRRLDLAFAAFFRRCKLRWVRAHAASCRVSRGSSLAITHFAGRRRPLPGRV